MVTFGQACLATSQTDQLVYAWNIYTGTILKTFKPNLSACNGSEFLFDRQGNVVGLVSLQADSKIINVWSLSKEGPIHKFIMNQKFTTISSSLDGLFLAAGTVDGSVMMWDLRDGSLIATFHAHYSSISVLKFTLDSRAVVTASADGSVHVWHLSRIFSGGPEIKPQIYWTDHNGMVSGLFLSRDVFERCKLLTCSKDSHCHLYSVHSDKKICSFKLPCPATCCTINSMESLVVIGGSDGLVYLFEINTLRQGMPDSASLVADSASGCHRLSTHSASISSITFSTDESILICASEDGAVSCWDTANFQLLRRLNFFKGPISSLHCALLPVDFSQSKTMTQSLPTFNLKRTISSEHSVSLSAYESLQTLSIPAPLSSAPNASVEHSLTLLQKEHAKLLEMYDELYSLTAKNVAL